MLRLNKKVTFIFFTTLVSELVTNGYQDSEIKDILDRVQRLLSAANSLPAKSIPKIMGEIEKAGFDFDRYIKKGES